MPKKDIHPAYKETKIRCTTCNHTFTSGSTRKDDINVDTCSNCHPFFTLKNSYFEKRGKIETFRKKMKKKDEIISKKVSDSQTQKDINKKEDKNTKSEGK